MLHGLLSILGSGEEAIANYVENDWPLFEKQARAALTAAAPHMRQAKEAGQ
jgi:hypothetical protein